MIQKLFRCNHRRSGFTLIEVLVVVAIIALLISILLPSLKTAREQSRSVVCKTGLNQTFKAVFNYTNDYQDVLPHMGFRASHDAIKYLWFTQISRYMGNELEMFLCPSDQVPMQREVAYNKAGRLKMADASDFPDLGDKPKFMMDVSYQGSCDLLSDAVRWEFQTVGVLAPMPRKITVFKRPAEAILLVEGQEETADSVAGTASDSCMRYSELSYHVDSADPMVRQTWRRHVGSSNFLFLDSHVVSFNPEQATNNMNRCLAYIQHLQDMDR